MRVWGTFGGYRGCRGALVDDGSADVGSELVRCQQVRARACAEVGGGGG